MRRQGFHVKHPRFTVPTPPPDPSPNVVSIGSTVRTSTFRTGLHLVGGDTLRWNTATGAALPAGVVDDSITVMGQACNDVMVHANGFGQTGNLWVNQSDPTSAWNWSNLDGRINAINQAGCRAYVMYGNPAPFCFPTLTGNDMQLKFWPNANAADANTFATALATRYLPGGAFGNGVYGFCMQNEFKGLWNGTRNRYEDLTTIYNGMRAAVKAVSANFKVGGPYMNQPGIAPGQAGYSSASSLTDPDYMPSGAGTDHTDYRSTDAWIYWWANKAGADFVCHDGNYRHAEHTLAWIRAKGCSLPAIWSEMYAGNVDDGYYSATPTTLEKQLRLIQNLIIAAYEGSSTVCVWGGDAKSAPPHPQNALWDQVTGVATNTALWMKMLKDNFCESQSGASGPVLKQFVSNNPGIVGICTATKIMILNRTFSDQVTDTPGGTVTLPARSVTLQ